MGKLEMHLTLPTFASPPPSRPKSRYRPILLALLTLICIPTILYRLAPQVSDAFITNLATSIRAQSSPSLCTKAIGTPHCCALFLDASPCVDECRKQHLDRATYALTEAYEVCEGVCLEGYEGECGG